MFAFQLTHSFSSPRPAAWRRSTAGKGRRRSSSSCTTKSSRSLEMKIVSIVGARPQFVKAAVVSKALREKSGTSEFLVHTGQHFDDNMSRVFFDEMGIPEPDANLGISGGGRIPLNAVLDSEAFQELACHAGRC